MKKHVSLTRIVSLFAVLTLLLSGCQAATSDSNEYGDSESTSTTTSSPKKQLMASPEQIAAPVAGDTIATITTTKGVIKMKFFPQYAPETVKNFTELSKKGFYNGLTFHRVIPGFMIQGGDPKGTGMGGETYKGPGTTLKGEVNPALHHVVGAVAMANRANPDTASSQFYIVQNKKGVAQLDGGYTIFGQVFEGQDVVDAIANVDRDDNDKPLTPVKMTKVEISVMK